MSNDKAAASGRPRPVTRAEYKMINRVRDSLIEDGADPAELPKPLRPPWAIFTAAFWQYAGERAVKTFAQALLAALTTAGISIGTVGLESVPWWSVFSVAGLSTLYSLLTAVAAFERAPAEE